jgi:cytochrome c peroxidase
MSTRVISILALAVVALAFTSATDPLFVQPENWPEPEYNFSRNPLHPDVVQLGRALFYDPILSRDNTISCASCHSQFNGFAHVDHKLSHGIDDHIGTRNAPALINLAWQKSFMWDGAINHLDMQSLFPITHPDEMDETLENVISKLTVTRIYPELFSQAFGNNEITGEKILKSISQFMLTLESYNARYDSVMKGQSTFTIQEKKGYEIFKNNCSSCHREPLFTNQSFENSGLKPDSILKDNGRIRVTGKPEDSLRFKVPTLRNIEVTFPYMHDGRFKRLSEVISHYEKGIVNSPTLSAQLKVPIVLNSNERVELTTFLLTLTDNSFLFNPAFSYPREILLPLSKD